ncbi:MAG: hypothetical protein R3B59_05060 [Dehalococcoidia bacterium]
MDAGIVFSLPSAGGVEAAMRATIEAVQPYELHGVRYYRVIYRGDGEDGLREARLSHDMVYADPQMGDVVEVRAILGIVDRITKVEG